MISRLTPRTQSLQYLSSLTFALASILPLLLFLYTADRHSILMESDVSLFLGISVLMAVLGLIYLRGAVKQIVVLAHDFTKAAQGESPRFNRRKAPSEVIEIAHIVKTSNQMLSELKSNTQELENLVLKLSTLHDLTEVVSRIPDITEMLQIVMKRAKTTVHAQAGSIMLIDEDLHTLKVVAAEGLNVSGMGHLPLRVGHGLLGRVAHSGEAILLDDVSEDSALHEMFNSETQITSFICMPLLAQKRVVGVLNLAKGSDQQAFNAADVKFLKTLLSHISFALENARLLEEARLAAFKLREVLQEKSLLLDKAQQQVLQSLKLSALGKLLAGVAHELNNPLTVILGYSQLLMNNTRDGKMHRELSSIFEGARLAAKIVQNLLAFARPEPAEKRLLNINEILSKVLDMMANEMRVNHIMVDTYFDQDLPPLMADPNQLQQVFLNLVANAQQAMQTHDQLRRLILRTFRRGDTVCIEFVDSGSGIEPEHIDHIFDPFFTTKDEGDGTGLGLSLSYGIIKAHDGQIAVESQAGEGTKFVVELPLGESALTQPDKPLHNDTRPNTSAFAKTSLKILIIDDEEMINEMLTAMLTHDGYQVDSAHTAVRGLQKLLEQQYDLVFCDVRMPVMDGPQLYRQLEQRKPHLLSRFIFMTGDVMSESTRQFLDENHCLYLAKPFTREKFYEVLEQAWRRFTN